jgi:ubiquinone biosynthesis protein Coq4
MKHPTPRQVLNKFYSDHDLSTSGGLERSSVKIKINSRFYFYFPNFDARRRALLKHDIHHLLTGYETTVAGESEICAWEIASGCKSYWAAFLIDVSGVMLGLIYFPRVLKAFSRGRKTKNLYHDIYSNEELLDMNIADLKRELYLDKYTAEVKLTISDTLIFLLFILFGTVYSIFTLPALPFVILYSLYIILKGEERR